MNEVLAASSVPGLVEISETDALQSSNERHTGSIKRSPEPRRCLLRRLCALRRGF